MGLRPRAVIRTAYPTPAATARVLGVSLRRYRRIRAMVTEYLARHGKDCAAGSTGKVRRRKRNAKGLATARRQAARRS